MKKIYSDEILYASHIYPEKPCNTLSDGEWQRLAVQIPAIIAWAIKANEISPEEYLAGKGKEYRNTPHLKTYGREGKPCPICGKLFVRIVVGGRSSCYCPECQKNDKQICYTAFKGANKWNFVYWNTFSRLFVRKTYHEPPRCFM